MNEINKKIIESDIKNIVEYLDNIRSEIKNGTPTVAAVSAHIVAQRLYHVAIVQARMGTAADDIDWANIIK